MDYEDWYKFILVWPESTEQVQSNILGRNNYDKNNDKKWMNVTAYEEF